MTTTDSPPQTMTRRRAVRAAGPASGSTAETTTVRLEKSPEEARPVHKPRKTGAPPRRPAHVRLVMIVASVFGALAMAGLGYGVAHMFFDNRDAQQLQQHDQRLVDTATLLAVNMYSFNQDTVEDSVRRVVDSTSGPLHDMLSRDNHTQILEQFFRSMGGSSEAVVTGAALERIDAETGEATVLVSVRVTTTDENGNNQPSTPSRMRITVREDETGRMTGSELNWPDGGN